MPRPPPTKNPDLDRPHDMVPNASHESVNTSKPEQAAQVDNKEVIRKKNTTTFSAITCTIQSTKESSIEDEVEQIFET
jgi:hypothetical protein